MLVFIKIYLVAPTFKSHDYPYLYSKRSKLCFKPKRVLRNDIVRSGGNAVHFCRKKCEKSNKVSSVEIDRLKEIGDTIKNSKIFPPRAISYAT